MSDSELVIGRGEVGTAIAEVLGIQVRDVEEPETDHARNVLHIAFPYSDDFTTQVADYQGHYWAKTVVVHSTVPPGTCDGPGWIHSPVRGRHPQLVESLTLFPKIFGGGGLSGVRLAVEWEERTGGPAMSCPRAVTTEIGKLYELLHFGVDIAIEKLIHDVCEEHGADVGVAYEWFAETYTQGYAALGYPQFRRPTLKHVDGPIGGHCVRENMAWVDHPLARMVEWAGFQP